MSSGRLVQLIFVTYHFTRLMRLTLSPVALSEAQRSALSGYREWRKR